MARQLSVQNVMKIGSESTEESAKFILVDEFINTEWLFVRQSSNESQWQGTK